MTDMETLIRGKAAHGRKPRKGVWLGLLQFAMRLFDVSLSGETARSRRARRGRLKSAADSLKNKQSSSSACCGSTEYASGARVCQSSTLGSGGGAPRSRAALSPRDSLSISASS